MKIGITFDLDTEYLALGYDEIAAAEFDSEDTIESIEDCLHRLGHETERIGNVRHLMQMLLDGRRWDLVFNICEGLSGFGREALVPALLDNHEIPYTFSDPLALSLALHKGVAKHIVRDVAVPTPDFVIVERAEDLASVDLTFPLFVKPVAEGSSKGIDRNSRVESVQELERSVRRLLWEFQQPVLVERYLPGREYTVGVVGTGVESKCIGGMEILLKEGAEAGIYSFQNKREWETLVDYRPIDGELLRACAAAALPAWRALGCRDAGRVDLRADERGNIQLLEVNPLAGLNAERSDLAILCRLSGISYPQLIAMIMQSVERRLGNPTVLQQSTHRRSA
ncbi:MAG: D-alanine--D-alanine ligase [Gammaproteobacteria bacterium]|nr:D-alanine--D-alanine ligase [Gammaproteobacteria bacterium]